LSIISATALLGRLNSLRFRPSLSRSIHFAMRRTLHQVTATDPAALLHEAQAAIQGNLQAHACAIAHRYSELGHPPRQMFDLLLKYAVSEDGSLHAEKFYRTSCEEFAATRPAFRGRYLTALARVTASEYGRPAAGYAEACELLELPVHLNTLSPGEK
jgi:hypothetical protein